MPVGIQRLNAKKSQPNERIVFIKPLKGPHEAVAQDYLERIAAQCLPIMKEHHLSVMTLEEYEPNREFVGRNFNSGEIIQLVLRARTSSPSSSSSSSSSSTTSSPHWLPFHYVQMVMMHELAHCVQMNHSRAFWAVRNLYADQMRTLWTRGYTGEGLWGRGALLASGEFERHVADAGEALPEHLCGGTFRSRRARKRARKGGNSGQAAGEELSYQQKKQRRIERKFGKHGVALGADENVKVQLEKGKRVQAAPRVAGSNRGRELRAAAALARFEQNKAEDKQSAEQLAKDGNQDRGGDDEEGSDYEDGDISPEGDPEADDALDLDGQKLLDSKGNHMVRVCEDGDLGDEDAANELEELQASITAYFGPAKNSKAVEGGGQKSSPSLEVSISNATNSRPSPSRTTAPEHVDGELSQPASASKPDTTQRQPSKTCGICSYENEAYTMTCQMCSNVLHPASVPGVWSCQRAPCQGTGYLNAGDCGTCGVCGQRRQGSIA